MEETGATVVMVTHDVDEAVLLSDRIVMMTNGPAATIGEILDGRAAAAARSPGAGARAPVRRIPRGGARVPLSQATEEGAHEPWAKQKLVVVGNGMAGCRTLEELLKLAPDMYDITVFGAEPHPNYNRILLSPVLAGEMTIHDIVLNDLRLVRRQRHHPARRQDGDDASTAPSAR